MSIIQTYWQVRFQPSTDFVALTSISDIEGRGKTVLTLQKFHFKVKTEAVSLMATVESYRYV